jgi:2-succinyl-5-enolpyruvyl-6-hydroxy-3-cyclohexene-1-carboxylate synthase
MSDTGSLNLRWSQALIAGFVAAGVTDAVISPGSRSTPLALAMLRQPRLRCHVAIDERSAAFFALGIAKVQQRPVLLLATSGTAPANWLPAIVEAGQAGVTLVAISADRPPELQNCGANQTVSQTAMFAPYVRAAHALGTPFPEFAPGYLHHLAAQVCERASWPHPGPVHINQPFREPLLPAAPCSDDEVPMAVCLRPPQLTPDMTQVAELAARINGRPGIIVCGEMPSDPHLAPALAALAKQLGCPILAEPLSGLRFGPHDRSHLCVGYNRWLEGGVEGCMANPEWIIRLGAFPVTRNLQNYVSRITATHAVIDPWPRWSDPARRITHLFRTAPRDVCQALLAGITGSADAAWLEAFMAKEDEAAAQRQPSAIHIVLDSIAEGSALFIGNSLAIRQLDSLSGHDEKMLHFFANRGASGIDGNISTAAGIAAAHGQTVALIGDLTCQHDLGGLALARKQDLVIVVVNNGGGGIFDYLPQRQLPEFEQGWRTPQDIDFSHAARMFDLGYAQADSNEALQLVLQSALRAGGAHLIELKQIEAA